MENYDLLNHAREATILVGGLMGFVKEDMGHKGEGVGPMLDILGFLDDYYMDPEQHIFNAFVEKYKLGEQSVERLRLLLKVDTEQKEKYQEWCDD